VSFERVETGCRVIDEKVGGFRRGAIILVLGPPMGGKRNVCRNFIARGLRLGDGCIVSCTNATAEQEHEEFKRITVIDAEKGIEDETVIRFSLNSPTI